MHFLYIELPVKFADQDIKVVAGALKLFLKELPNPLISYSVYFKFTKAESELVTMYVFYKVSGF